MHPNTVAQLAPENLHSRITLRLARKATKSGRLCAFGKDAHDRFTGSLAQIFVARRSSGGLRQRVPIVPRHPAIGLGSQFPRVPLQLGQVVEGVHAAQLTAMDQTHKQVARLRPVQRPIK